MAQPTPLHGKNRRGATRPPDHTLHAPALARPATIVRDRRYVTDRRNGEARRLQSTQRRFAARARPRHFHFKSAHAVFLGFARNILARHLGRIRGRFTRPLETHGARRRPRNRITLGVGDRDHCVIERRVHVSDAGGDVLAFPSPDAGSFFTHSRPFRGPLLRASYARNYFFLPAIALAGPLRVRALVWVRWPRTGRPRRC